ncbi:MAG TPA: CHRD domain-containing protein, partial [Rhodothermales bacterium]|nr:CHRD domain-containing protein [Rhodothermales bacterium]
TVSGSHVHPGAAGTNGGILIHLTNTGGTSGTFSGSGTLTAAQVDALRTQGLYVNVHSTGPLADGEIRGQLARAVTEVYTATLRGSNEVPANTSTATGSATATFNPSNSTLSVTGNYNGLSATVSGSHVHTGAAGINGGIIIHLTNTGGTSGTYSGSGTLTAAQIDALRTQGLYVNVHSTGTFSAGEIRGQLVLSNSFTASEPGAHAGSALDVAVHGQQVQFRVAETQPVRAELFDVLGRRLAVLFDGDAAAGLTQTVHVPAGLATGVYLLRLSARATVETAPVLVR